MRILIVIRNICACILLFCLLPMSYGEWKDRFTPAKEVSLEELLEKPDSWLDIPIQIPLRFAWISDVYVPYRTRFSQDVYLNFTAWDIQEHIWESQGFNKPHAYFYVEKDNPELKTILKFKTFDTICVLGKIEGMFAGKPFIRVVWFERLPGELNILNLKMINTSLKLYKQRRFEEALAIFQNIFDTNPPQDIQSMLYKATAKVYMYEKQAYEYAFVELKKAEMATPLDTEVHELLQECTLHLGNKAQALLQAWEDGTLQKTHSTKSPANITAESTLISPEPGPEANPPANEGSK